MDEAYLEGLLKHVRQSELDAVALLAMDKVYDEGGRLLDRQCSFYVPNTHILELGRRHGELLPVVSVHPGRPDAMEELERCLEQGAVMMKILPNCQNIDCNLPRYEKFWIRMAEAGLPLLAHTGGEHTLPVVRRDLQDPAVLELPLRCGVTVIAAHSAAKAGLLDEEHFFKLRAMMERHGRLYADNSAFNIPVRSRRYRDTVRDPLFRERVVHGSDHPVPIMAHWAWMRGLLAWRDVREIHRLPSPLQQDIEIKRRVGVPEECLTRGASLLRRRARAA